MTAETGGTAGPAHAPVDAASSVKRIRASDHFRLSDPWGQLSLPGMLRVSARARKNRPAVTDAPDRTDWTDGAPRKLDYLELGRLVATITQTLLLMRLPPESPVLVALPNIVEQAATLLAVQEAGLLPALASPSWSAEDLRLAAEATSARAIVTVNRLGDMSPASRAAEAAAGYLGIRFVAAFGEGVPTGVAALDRARPASAPSSGALPSPLADALITFDRMDGVLRPIVHTHQQIMSLALAVTARTPLAASGALMQTVQPLTMGAVAAAIAAPLLTGSHVVLHGPLDTELASNQAKIFPDGVFVLSAEMDGLLRGLILPRQQPAIILSRGRLPSQAADLDEAGQRRHLALISIGERFTLPLSTHRLPLSLPHPLQGALGRMPLAELEVGHDGQLTIDGPGLSRVFGDREAVGPLMSDLTASRDGGHIIMETAQAATEPPISTAA